MAVMATQEENKVAAYWDRLDPVLGPLGYTRKNPEGSDYIHARVSVYDDRADVGQRGLPSIKVQVRPTGPQAKVSVLSFETLDQFNEFLTDLMQIGDAMSTEATAPAVVTEDSKPSLD